LSIAFIDWGGTHFRCVVEGEESFSVEKPSADIDIIHELETLFSKFAHISRVGISFAGQVHNNIILSAPNITAKNIDLNTHFPDTSIFVQNDLKCAALAEAAYFKEGNIGVLYVGTGLGSAYIENGRLICGESNIAGEIGHIPYRTTGEKCGCGKDNCLELTASGSGLMKMAKTANLDAKTIDELLKSKEGKKIVEEFVSGVGYGASLIVTMLNPKILVIGGGIIKANEWLAGEIKEYISKNGFKKSVDGCEIKLSCLQNGSLEGARLLAL
jgi:glucokinase